MRADAGPRLVTVKQHTRRAPTRSTPPVTPAVAQRNQIVSSARAVSAAAYRAQPLSQRRTAVAAARRMQAGSAQRGAILDVHGRRAADISSGRRAGQLAAQAHINTPAVLPTNKMPAKAGPWTGFAQEQNRRMGLKPAQAIQDPQIRQQTARELSAAKAGTLPLDIWEKLFKHGVKTPGVYAGGATKSAVSFGLEQVARPGAAIAAAQYNQIKREGAAGLIHPFKKQDLKAGEAGFAHPNEHITDWNRSLKELGAGKVTQIVGGLAASIATDPVTYFAGGAGIPAKIKAMKALEDARTAGATEADALKAAKTTFDAAPLHEKMVGLRLGVRGTPARAVQRIAGKKGTSKVIMTPPMGGRPAALVHMLHNKVRVTEATSPRLANLGEGVRTAVNKIAPNVRPGGWHPIDWEYAKRTGRGISGRAGVREAQRHGAGRLAAYQTMKDWSPQEVQTWQHAVEAVPPNGDFSFLPDKLKVVAEAWDKERQIIQNQRVQMGVAHPLEAGSRVGIARPHAVPPDRFANVARTRKQLASARTARDAALRDVGRMKGRREILGLRIPGGQFAVGGRGKDVAQANLAQARDMVKQAAVEHRAEGALARQWNQYQKDIHQELHAPFGFLPRSEHPDYGQAGTVASRAGGSGNAAKIQNKSRLYSKALEFMTPAERARYDPRPHVAIARYVQQHNQNLRLHELNQRLAAMGENRAIGVTQIGDWAGKQHYLFSRDQYGFTPLFDSKTGMVDHAKLRAAVHGSRSIVEARPDQLEAVRAMAAGAKAGPRTGITTALRRVRVTENSPKYIQDELQPNRTYDRLQRTLKTAQTSVNPGYQISNALGDSFNAVVHDTGAADFVAAGRLRSVETAMNKADKQLNMLPPTHRLRKALQSGESHVEHYPHYGELSDTDVIRGLVRAGGLRTGITSAELRTIARSMDLGQKRGVMEKLIDKAQNVGDWREDLVRMATARGALKRGASFEEAAQHSLKAHIDYANLSHEEKTFFRRVVPYWTWVSRNTAIQARGIVSRPGPYATTYKVQSSGANAAGYSPDWRQHLRSQQQQAIPIPLWGLKPNDIPGHPLGHGNIPFEAGPKLPISDIGNLPYPQRSLATGGLDLEKTAQEFAVNTLGKVSPLIKNPIEGLTGFSFFTLDRHKRPAVPAWPFMPQELTHQIQDPRTGKMTPGMNWRWGLLATFPAATTAQTFSPPSKHAQPGRTIAGASSMLAGIRLASSDPRIVKINENFERMDDLDRKLQDVTQRQSHQPGATWQGRVKVLNSAKAKLQAEIHDLERELGIPVPAAAGGPGRRPKVRIGGGGSFGSGSFGSGGFGRGHGTFGGR